MKAPDTAGGRPPAGEEAMLAAAFSRHKILAEAWREALAALKKEASGEFYGCWLAATRELAAAPWEVAWEWLRRSPSSGGGVAPAGLVAWARLAARMARYNPAGAVDIIRSGVDTLGRLPAGLQHRWLAGCLELAEINWPAAMVYFSGLPELFDRIGEKAAARWLAEGRLLAGREVELGRAYFSAYTLWRHRPFDGFFAPWVERGKELAGIHPDAGRAYFTAGAALAAALKENFSTVWLNEWADRARQLAVLDVPAAVSFLANSPAVFSAGREISPADWADCGRELLARGGGCAQVFFANSARALQEVTWPELRGWVDRLMRTTAGDADRLCEALSLSTRESLAVLTGRRQGVALVDEERGLAAYAAALFDCPVNLKSSALLPAALAGKRRLFATTDGRRIYLPELVDEFPAREDNHALLKMMLVHEISHLAAGTYQITAVELAGLARQTGLPAPEYGEVSCLEEWLDLFPDYPLMRVIFELVEDARVDARTQRQYPGMSKDFTRFGAPVQPPAGGEAAALIRLSLGRPLPADLAMPPGRLFREKILANRRAAVTDSLAVAAAWYRILEGKVDAGELEARSAVFYRGRLCPDLAAVNAEVEEEPRRSGRRRETASRLRVRPGAPDTPTAYRTRQFYSALKSLLQEMAQEENDSLHSVSYYDEWDYTVDGYKPDWCRVGEIIPPPSSMRLVERTLQEYYGLVGTLKRYFALLRPDRFRRYRRQEEGEQEDLDAIVEAWSGRRAGMPASGFMIRRDKRLREVAVAFLLDQSGSTDQVLDNGKTILDIEREAVVIMAEALEVIGDRYALYGFNGEGRHGVKFHVLKEFDEPYGMTVRQRFGGLASDGLTRLGAAIRHTAGKLQKVEAAVKLLLILSDGRPYDVDYYPVKNRAGPAGWLQADDTFYAREDCRMALREARMKRITTFCITVDRRGTDYLEDIFGDAGYVVIDDVTLLPLKLPDLYKRLTV
ncbi:VWA domain-containing protein [Desulfotomaculum copahuensis]|uniref:VWFA domain-containing protein n=1 Tax=Desulfotomaculum copahuensis TaxID=1838280 RepID=A0A1B7LH70_9FIRM|nr:VWA domain-containing protein [Desulfotomaculum copahuensis]OAT85554.1 hypothetical protein A6M21_17250 [Desulfotomaculum copahuensis]